MLAEDCLDKLLPANYHEMLGIVVRSCAGKWKCRIACCRCLLLHLFQPPPAVHPLSVGAQRRGACGAMTQDHAVAAFCASIAISAPPSPFCLQLPP
eukprot:7904415-Pyramimonas_sp.AAC.1